MGTKATNLVYLAQLFPRFVPPFYVLDLSELFTDWEKYRRYLCSKCKEPVQDILTHDHDISSTIRTIPLSTVTIEKLMEHISQCDGSVSCRTSALHEDTRHSSYAGLYHTSLFVTTERDTLIEAVLQCVSSLFSARAVAYFQSQNTSSFDQNGSVIIQKMFIGTINGVTFTDQGDYYMHHHFTKEGAVVDGAFTQIATWDKTVEKNTLSTPQLLTRKVYMDLLESASELESAIGCPVDIEWATDGKRLALLQYRPITTTYTAFTISWDNTNISESYPGITLPLTYSFIRDMYRRVYPEFLQLVGQDDELIRQSQDIFDHMLGYQKGRVYYQLQNWYKLIQLLPGYSYNKEFFDRMLMPVRTEKVIATHANRGVVAMIKKWLYVFRFVALLLRTDSLCASFTAAYEQKRKHYNSISWETCNGRTLSKLYERITSDYLHHWSIPILNDFRVMIYHGIFQKILYRYATHEVYLQLLGNIKNVASIRPIHDLDTIYKSIHALWESECDFDRIYKIMTTCRSTEAVRRLISEYKKKHGGRTPDELKLENPRLIQDEKLFLTYLIYAARQYTPSNEQKPFANYSKNSLPILVRLVLHPITRQLRSAIAQREKFRFYRAEVFGMARTVFLTGAQRLLDEGLIRDIQDVFYLTKQELFDILNGHDSLYDAKHRVDERKKRFCIYAKDQPARRLTSHGVVPAVHTINDMPSDDATSVPTGLGVSPGVSTASVVVMDTFDPMVDLTGKILITHHTDPGWTLLFLKIKGVVVERGNALSHASIIARELHIPAIVSVPHIVSLIKTGDVIRINGTTGTIDILSSA